jgi:O-glycosyl hydrolase
MAFTKTEITIHPDTMFQTIDGFGASAAWWAQIIGGWENAEQRIIMDLLFNNEKGIGLSILRYNIGGGAGKEIDDPWRRTECFEVSPGKYDWSRDANALSVMEHACENGITSIVAFANSPPAGMTISGSAAGHPQGRSNIDSAMYGRYSNFLLDVAEFMVHDRSLPVTFLSPVNEPRWDWNVTKGQEGCHFSHDECASITFTLLETLRKREFDIELSVIEAAEWEGAERCLEKIFTIPGASESLPHFSIHSYWSDDEHKKNVRRYIDNNHPGLTLWMSEWCEMREGKDTGMESALTMASVIHEDLVIGGVSSWQYWIAVSKYNFRDGLLYVDETNREVTETKRLWVLGNYSRFIKPGYKRISVTSNGELAVSAFTDESKTTTVLVFINNAPEKKLISLEPNHFDSMTVYETSEIFSLEQRYQGFYQKEFILNARSVSTFILTREEKLEDY